MADLVKVDTKCRQQGLIALKAALATIPNATEIGARNACVRQQPCGRSVGARECEQQVFGANSAIPRADRLTLSSANDTPG
jgi:hypothetical protein